MEFMNALNNATIFGVALAAFVTIVTQQIKNRWFPQGGDTVKWIAIGIGTVLGGAYLFGVFPISTQPFDFAGAGLRVATAFVWAFMAPFGYDLLKQTAAKGMKEQVHEIESKATLGKPGEG
jgi:hypothetical protein